MSTGRVRVRGRFLTGVLSAACWAMAAGGEGEEEETAHPDDEQPAVVHFSADQRQALGIAAEAAASARIAVYHRATGQVALNLDRTAHVTPRVSGVVTEVRRFVGDRVEEGDVLAVLDSRQLAEAKADFLTARARRQLAETSFAREEKLWQEQISSERQYLDARYALAEASIALRAAEQRLHALGVGDDALRQLPDDPGDIARYPLVAPMAGTVLDRHATVGEVLSDTDPAFLVADLRTVWVELSIHLEDLGRVRQGQGVQVQAGAAGPQAAGQIAYLSPVVDQDTRTARARVVLANLDGTWRPGTPVHAFVAVDSREVAVAVPRAAVHDVEGKTCVFVDSGDGIRLRQVAVGFADGEPVEVTAGLEAGERVIARGGVHVKSALLRSQIGGHED